MLHNLERSTKEQIEDLKKRRFEMFKVTASGERADENCNADMIKILEKQLREIKNAIAHSYDLEHRASK